MNQVGKKKNTYFNTSLATAPKSDEPQYCIKNAATPKATNFNYQHYMCTIKCVIHLLSWCNGVHVLKLNLKLVAENEMFEMKP